MPNYCTIAEVKEYLQFEAGDTSQDTLLTQLVDDCSREVELFTKRTFYARTETREFDADGDVRGNWLFLDDDLLSVTTLTNGNGDVISSTQYVLEPKNVFPKYAIRLKSSSSQTWQYDEDPEQAIIVAGTWGFSSTTPGPIRLATIRISAWRWRQKDAPFEATAMSDGGGLIVPTSMPADIERMLAPYERIPLK